MMRRVASTWGVTVVKQSCSESGPARLGLALGIEDDN